MTLSASTAYSLASNAASVHDTDQVNQEISLAEMRIQNAATYGLFTVAYGASLIGNPSSDPSVDASLTTNQLAFRNAMQAAGFVVSRDSATGYWQFDFAQEGPEQTVTVYEIHTSVTPGPVSAQTVTLLTTFFHDLNPTVTSKIYIGASAISGTYIHLCVVQQQTNTDLSTDIRASLTAAGLGYSNGNTTVSKRT